jgi:hypothetical protein
MVLSVLWFTASDYLFSIFWPWYCLSFDLRLLITSLVSFGHGIGNINPFITMSEWVIVCLTANEFFFSYIMARTTYIWRNCEEVRFVLDQPCLVIFRSLCCLVFFRSLCCLVFFDLQLLITSLVSSNFFLAQNQDNVHAYPLFFSYIMARTTYIWRNCEEVRFVLDQPA